MTHVNESEVWVGNPLRVESSGWCLFEEHSFTTKEKAATWDFLVSLLRFLGLALVF